VPRICTFYGIVITMYYKDHAPSRFHARYAEHEALIAIESQEAIEGALPPQALALVTVWASEHRPELRDNWERA
jgi:hypothetical protein